MHLFALSHVGGLLVAFTLFSTIPMWHHYAAESPGAHWKYEGANGPEWCGSIKERWAICSAGENGTSWSMQSPIDLDLNVWGDNLNGFNELVPNSQGALQVSGRPF